MIAQLRGRLGRKTPARVVVEVNGVGYEVFVSLQTFYRLPALGAEVELLTYTHVREDTLQLYGFLDQGEKDVFVLLCGVAGVGPRLALNILSRVAAPDLAAAVAQGDVPRLVSIPGVGRKTAERLVVELRDRAHALADGGGRSDARGEVEREAVSALENLGYRRRDAERAVGGAGKTGALELPELIRQALRQLAPDR